MSVEPLENMVDQFPNPVSLSETDLVTSYRCLLTLPNVQGQYHWFSLSGFCEEAGVELTTTFTLFSVQNTDLGGISTA